MPSVKQKTLRAFSPSCAVLAIVTDVLNLCLDESVLLSSVSTGRDVFVEIQGFKLGQKWRNT